MLLLTVMTKVCRSCTKWIFSPTFVAPHKEEHAHTDIIDDPVVTEARKGDYYKFMKNTGGGGGHALYVKNYKVVVHYYWIIIVWFNIYL